MSTTNVRTTKIVLGTILSAIVFGFLVPVGYSYLARAIDFALGFPLTPMGRGTTLILSSLILAMGMFWILWSYSYLIFIGQGSPVEAFGVALEPTKHLVTAGPYAYVRHPMTLGLLLILFGVGFAVNSISGIALAPILGLLLAVYLRAFEEKQLVKRFGDAYEHYREHVPMLIPLPRPYVPPVPTR